MEIAEKLMLKFAKDTGLNSNNPPRRYLWTDAFAVCNFIQLHKDTVNDTYKQLAINLVDQVHSTLGKHREDDERTGWLGSSEHPTKNGLRIGKSLPERKIGEPIDQLLEWGRDGQYFHYLTKWMLALIRLGDLTKEEKYNTWAVDLLEASRSFIHDGRMYWKMSINLSRPLVPSMGQHDPLNGYVTFKVVSKHVKINLEKQITQMRSLMKEMSLMTTDPLGIGELLAEAYRLYQMEEESDLISKLSNAAKAGIQFFNSRIHSLAFRELCLSMGLKASEKMNVLNSYWNLGNQIIDYWLNHRDWKEHEDINQVMLATSLMPGEFLMV